jgi:hypothetical protein
MSYGPNDRRGGKKEIEREPLNQDLLAFVIRCKAEALCLCAALEEEGVDDGFCPYCEAVKVLDKMGA